MKNQLFERITRFFAPPTRITALLFTLCTSVGAIADYAPGDTIEWSNANTTAAIYSGSNPEVINECHFDFQIPASADLPARSIVKIKSITFASLNTDGKFYREQNNYKSDPGFINLNGIKSDAVNGVTFSSDNYTGTFTDKINSTTTQEDYALKYTFSSDCRISVGVNYPAATAASKGATGYGIAFLHPNGNCIYGSSTDKASVRYVQSPASNALITPYASTSSTTGKGNGKVAKDAGYYPVYIVKAEVVSIADLTPDFEYNTTAGSVTVANRSGIWMDSLSNGGNSDLGLYRVGPGGSGMVCDVGSVTTPPYSGMAGKTSPFSFAIYADVSQVPSSTTKHVIVDFGKSSVNKLVLYRLGDNLQLGFFDGSNNGLGAHATLPVPASGYHFIAGVCDTSTGTVTLYVDSASNTQTRNTATTLGEGFQLASIHSNNTGFGKGTGFALSKFIGYDVALTGEEIATIRADYPATDGTQITANISPSISGKTLTVYTSAATDNQYLGITAGTLTIPAGNTVTVPQMMILNTANVTVNIAGTVEINSIMDSLPTAGGDFISGNKGILFGGADAFASGTYNITGSIDAPDAYLWATFQGDNQTININGGTVSVKGIRDNGRYGTSLSTINLTGGGVLEVGEIVVGVTGVGCNPGYRNFNTGTYRVLSSGIENRAIVFGAGSGEYTTLDPNGNTLTFPATAYRGAENINNDYYAITTTTITGSGDIKVASSVSGGKVKFNSLTTDYTGNITVAANSTMELVAGAYAGTITVETGGTLEINPGADVDYTCSATLAGAGSVVIKSGTVTLANAPTVTSRISVDSGATLILPTMTTVGVTGSGTLEIPDGVEVTITANNVISVASLKGPGSLIMSGANPISNTTLQGLLKNSNWNGTFAIMNVAALNGLEPHLLGNSGSKLQLTGATGYFARKNTAENVAAQPELVLVNGTGDYAYGFRTDNGFSYTKAGGASTDSYTIVRKLSGTGTLKDDNDTSQLYVFNDASGFSGSISQTGRDNPFGKTYLFATDVTPSSLPGQASNITFDGDKVTCGTIDVRAGAAVSIGNNCSWQSQNGIRIAGNVTLKGSATLSSATTFVGGAKLIFEAGSVLNATTVTLPATGTVTLDVTGLTIPSAGYTLISGVAFTAADCARFSIAAGSGKYYALEPDGTALKIYPNGASLTANQSVVRYESLMGAIMALCNSEFADAYVTELGDNTVYGDADLLGENIAHDADGNYYKATVKIGAKGYRSLASAVSNAVDNDIVILLADNAEANIALNGKSITFSEGSYTFSGSFTGNGTLVLGAALKSPSSDSWAAGWTGTVELKNITTAISDFNFAHYGNATSTVKANNVLIRMPETSGEYGNVGEINIVGEGLKFGGNVINDKTFTFSAKLTGSGPLRIGTPGGDSSHAAVENVTKYVFKGDISEFTGAVNYNDLGSYRAAIVFADADDEIPTSTDWGQIIVTEDVTLKSSGTLYGAGGFIIKGAIEILSGGSISTGGVKISGDGMIVLTEGSSTVLDSSKFNATQWTGTVELKNISTVIQDFDFANYGTASSTVRANNVLVRMPTTGGEYGNVGEINIVGEGLRFGGDAIAGQNFTFSAPISGSGKIRVGTRCNTSSPAHTCYIFKGDISEFRGGVDFNDADNYKANIVFQSGNDEIPTGKNEWGEIILSQNANVSLTSEMYGPAGIVLTGAINVLDGGSVRVDSGGNKIMGDGMITYATMPTAAPAFNNNEWTGTVELPSFSAGGQDLNSFGTSNSKIKLKGVSGGWLKVGNMTVNPEIELAGNLTVSDMTGGYNYVFSRISGAGNISFSPRTQGSLNVTITTLCEGYDGEVINNMTTVLNIGTLALAQGASVAGGTKLLTTSGTGAFSIGSVTAGGVAQNGLQLAYESDGVYVASASYGGRGYKTLQAAITAAGDANLADITVLSGAVAPSGYVLVTENDVVKVYKVVATFNGTGYGSLQAAVDAWAAADQMTAYQQHVRLADNVTAVGVSIPARQDGVPLSLNGMNYTLTAPVTIAANATLQPLNITLSGNLTVNGTLFVPDTLSVDGAVTFADDSVIAVTTWSDSTVPKLTATGTVTVSGDLTVWLQSPSLTAGTYLLATGSGMSAANAQATVKLSNGTEAPAWTFEARETSIYLVGAAAKVGGVKYEDFDDAVMAAAGVETIELLGNVAYTLSAGETVIVKAGEKTFTPSAPEGYAVVSTTVSEGVVSYTTKKYVARLENPADGSAGMLSPVQYTSVAGAVADVIERSAGYTGGDPALVTLLDDVTLDATVAITKKMRLNLNGKTLTANVFDAINNSTQLAILGSSGSISVTSGNSVALTAAAATLTVSSGVTLSPAPTSGVAGYIVKDSSGTYSLVRAADTTTGVEISAANEAAAIAAAGVSLTSAQKTQGLEESYYKLVATATGESNKWNVKAVLDEDVVGVAFTASDAPVLTTSASTCTATFTLGSGTKKGLYYGIATVSDPAAEHPTVTVRAEAKADTDNQEITLTPNIDFGSGNVIYYRWSVSDSQRITPPDPEP